MIGKWEIRKIGSKKALLLKGDFKDIVNIIKKIGPMLSRPERLLKGDYNFIMYILKSNDLTEEKIKKAIENITSKITEKKQKDIEKKEDIKDLSKDKEVEIPMPDFEVKLETKEEKKEESIIIPKGGPVTPKRISEDSVDKKDGKKTEQKPDHKKLTPPPSPKLSQRSIDRLKMRWSIELPLNPTLSFQTLITGSHNRFAHAASMAVVENPGVMYNPILIWGPIGSGKSHFIHSMSYGLSSTMGQKNIFVTNGVKFSVGVTLAIKEGFIDSIAQLIENSKVIIVDDIHLMLINKENKAFISKVISDCMSSNKQVIFSSLFSPKELEPLESMLGIEISQGWMVDIKPPNPQTYKAILNQILTNMDVKLSEDDIKRFFVDRSLDFRTLTVMLFRMKKLEKYISSQKQSLLHQDLLDMLFGDNDDLSSPTPQEIKDVNRYASSPDSFYKWGIFYPKGMKDYVNYVLYKLSQTFSSIIKTSLSWYLVFEEEYDPEEVYGVAFKIGNTVLEKNVNGIIVIGPQPTSPLAAREAEFRHLVDKIVESLNVRSAWIYSSRLKSQSNYLNALLDLI
ncbi:MAG: DnaA ATPase domain-containing protein [Elusimicrobiales bacterium]